MSAGWWPSSGGRNHASRPGRVGARVRRRRRGGHGGRGGLGDGVVVRHADRRVSRVPGPCRCRRVGTPGPRAGRRPVHASVAALIAAALTALPLAARRFYPITVWLAMVAAAIVAFMPRLGSAPPCTPPAITHSRYRNLPIAMVTVVTVAATLGPRALSVPHTVHRDPRDRACCRGGSRHPRVGLPTARRRSRRCSSTGPTSLMDIQMPRLEGIKADAAHRRVRAVPGGGGPA